MEVNEDDKYCEAQAKGQARQKVFEGHYEVLRLKPLPKAYIKFGCHLTSQKIFHEVACQGISTTSWGMLSCCDRHYRNVEQSGIICQLSAVRLGPASLLSILLHCAREKRGGSEADWIHHHQPAPAQPGRLIPSSPGSARTEDL